jgi:hypothetical protein
MQAAALHIWLLVHCCTVSVSVLLFAKQAAFKQPLSVTVLECTTLFPSQTFEFQSEEDETPQSCFTVSGLTEEQLAFASPGLLQVQVKYLW